MGPSTFLQRQKTYTGLIQVDEKCRRDVEFSYNEHNSSEKHSFYLNEAIGPISGCFSDVPVLSPIFNRNFLYQDIEGIHEILCTSKNPSTIGTMWLKVHHTGPLPCLPEDQVGCVELLFVFDCCSSPHG